MLVSWRDDVIITANSGDDVVGPWIRDTSNNGTNYEGNTTELTHTHFVCAYSYCWRSTVRATMIGAIRKYDERWGALTGHAEGRESALLVRTCLASRRRRRRIPGQELAMALSTAVAPSAELRSVKCACGPSSAQPAMKAKYSPRMSGNTVLFESWSAVVRARVFASASDL